MQNPFFVMASERGNSREDRKAVAARLRECGLSKAEFPTRDALVSAYTAEGFTDIEVSVCETVSNLDVPLG